MAEIDTHLGVPVTPFAFPRPHNSDEGAFPEPIPPKNTARFVEALKAAVGPEACVVGEVGDVTESHEVGTEVPLAPFRITKVLEGYVFPQNTNRSEAGSYRLAPKTSAPVPRGNVPDAVKLDQDGLAPVAPLNK